MATPNILFIDDDVDLLEVYQLFFRNALKANVLTAVGPNDLPTLLKQTQFDLVVCDLNMPTGSVEDVLKVLNQHGHRDVFFAICTGESIKSFKAETHGKSLFAVLDKADIVADIKKLAQLFSEKWTPRPQAQPSSVLQESEGGFIPLSLNAIQRMNVAVVDLYIRLADLKFVHLVRKGQPIQAEDIEKYSIKGVQNFYFEEGSLNEVVNDLLSRFEQEVKKSVDQTLGDDWLNSLPEGAEVLNQLIRKVGMTKDVQVFVEREVKLILNSIRQFPLDISQYMKKLSLGSKLYIETHSLILAYTICWIATFSDWANDSIKEKLILTCLLHDIDAPLGGLLDVFRTRNEIEEYIARWSISEKIAQETFEHPTSSAKRISKLGANFHDSALIVAQHHEFPDGSGYPLGLKADRLSKLSLLFIFAEDVLRDQYKKREAWTFEGYLKLNRKFWIPGPIADIVMRLESANT